jgi:hypothetical protein
VKQQAVTSGVHTAEKIEAVGPTSNSINNTDISGFGREQLAERTAVKYDHKMTENFSKHV